MGKAAQRRQPHRIPYPCGFTWKLLHLVSGCQRVIRGLLVSVYSIQLSYERVKGVNTNNFLINCNPKSVFDLFFFKES